MKRLILTVKLGDLKLYGSIENDVIATLSIDYKDDNLITDTTKQIQDMVDVLICSVMAKKAEQDGLCSNSILYVEEPVE